MTNKPKALCLDVATGILVKRDLTDEEIEEIEQLKIESEKFQEKEDAKIAARQSALAKLTALGFTEEEIGAL
jgi:hypothetical protein